MKQPRALYLLNFVSLWECFSYYGMRSLLVLYMIRTFDYSDVDAFALYALYTTLVELAGIAGGIVADRFLGFKQSIALGGWTIALGHICMTIPMGSGPLYAGLALIIVGTGLFRTNCMAFLGEFYQENDVRRDSGYALYYTGINFGGFLASIICGIIGEMYGMHFGFGIACIGMLTGNIALYFGNEIFEGKGKVPIKSDKFLPLTIAAMIALVPLIAISLYRYDIALYIVPLIIFFGGIYIFRGVYQGSIPEKKKIQTLFFYIGMMVLFYACEEQLGSSLVVFTERYVDRTTFLGSIPASSMITFNPLTILIAGPLLSIFFGKYCKDALKKIGISFAFLGISFLILFLGCFLVSATGFVSLGYGLTGVIILSVGELFIGPTILSAASEIAAPKLRGLTMSPVTLGFSLANMLSGFLSTLFIVPEGADSLTGYSGGFGIVACIALACGGSSLIMNKKRIFQ